MNRSRESQLHQSHLFASVSFYLALNCILLTAPIAYGQDAPHSPMVLAYLGERAGAMASKLPTLPQDKSSWEQRREQIRRDLSDVLGLPEREPMKAAIMNEREENGLMIQDVMILWHERAYLTAQVLRPKDTEEPLPAIVQPPGWVEGRGKRFDFSTTMARKGYLMLVVDDPRVSDRKAPYAGLYGLASAAGIPAMGIQVFDQLRAFDYLLTRSDVDPGRIGISGLCQGSEQTWLAACLEERFKVAVPVCGTTTYEGWARMPAFENVGLSDPSPYIEYILNTMDWHEIDAGIAPRPVLTVNNSGDNWWPISGFNKVVSTLEHVYGLYGQPERFAHVRRLESHDFMPFITEIANWFDTYLKPLPKEKPNPLPCGKPENHDFSMIHYMQRRIERLSHTYSDAIASKEQWETYRNGIVDWLSELCKVGEVQGGSVYLYETTSSDDITIEMSRLALDGDFSTSLYLFKSHKETTPARKYPTIVLSHDSGQCQLDDAVIAFSKQLAEDGFIVAVPDHASTDQRSKQPVNSLSNLYGVSDTVGLPPIVQRVWDNQTTLDYLRTRGDVDGQRIYTVGLGSGGVDACFTALIEPAVAGCASVGATSVREWGEQVVPGLQNFVQIMPYLPGLCERTDMPYCYAALAPRPLLLVDATDRTLWPESGYRHTTNITRKVYALENSGGHLTCGAAQSPWGIAEVRAWLKQQKHPS